MFGYQNVEVRAADGRRDHVERRIDEPEAAVIRRIFDLCAQGCGFRLIAHRLNAEGAASPRSIPGRRRGWSAYRGEVVWSRTK